MPKLITNPAICPLTILVTACACLLLVRGSVQAQDDASASGKRKRVFEIRTYTTNPGKLEALHTRFRDHTNRLFKKHGMELIAYWTPKSEKDGAKDTLIYVLAYPSAEARTKAWQGFLNDPDWKKAYAASVEDGRLVKNVKSVMLAPTDYSPIK